jgi:hypothetical protein
MSLVIPDSYTSQNGSGVAATTYSFNFKFFQNSEIIVNVTDSLSNVTPLSLANGDYTITGAGNDLGGSITIAAAIPTTSKVTIARVVEATQKSSFTTGDRLPAKTLEAALDKITMLYQQAVRTLNKSVRGADTASDLTPLATFPTDGIYNLSNDHGALKWLTPSTTSIGTGSIIPGNISTQTQTGWSFPATVTSSGGFIGNLTGNASSSTTAAACTGNAATATLAASATTAAACTGNSATASAPFAGSALSKAAAKAWVTINPNAWLYSAANTFTTAYTTNVSAQTSTVTMTKTAAWTAATGVVPAMIPQIGDWVTVSGVTGVTSINGTYQVTAVTNVTGNYSFSFVVPSVLTGTAVSTGVSLKGVSVIGTGSNTSFNVSSIARGATGTLTVNFTGTPFADTNYLLVSNIFDFSGSSVCYLANPLVTLVSGVPTNSNKTTSSCTIVINNNAGTLVDLSGYAELIFFGN